MGKNDKMVTFGDTFTAYSFDKSEIGHVEERSKKVIKKKE